MAHALEARDDAAVMLATMWIAEAETALGAIVGVGGDGWSAGTG